MFRPDRYSRLARQWARLRGRDLPALAQHPRVLSAGIRLLESARTGRPPKLVLPCQPFDTELLALSPLFRRSRARYLEAGGTFCATLVSSPRTLSSPILLEPRIEYSPIEPELLWSASDPGEARRRARLLELRGYVTSTFHEQNHRLLWRELPAPATDATSLRRYLNLAESLVVATDMALGDQLGFDLASLFYLTGSIYDPGSGARADAGSARQYRNYLQACVHATYLVLEGFTPRDLPRAISALFPGLGPLAARAAHRSAQLSRSFVDFTNPVWQKRHQSRLREHFSRGPKRERLKLSHDPMDHGPAYMLGERWFAGLGL